MPKATGSRSQLRGDVVGGTKLPPPTRSTATYRELGLDKRTAAIAQQLAALPTSLRDAIASRERGLTETLRDERRATLRRERMAPPLPAGKFRLLLADPAWQYEHPISESRAIENHYPTMSLEQLCALKVPAANDSVMAMWSTSPKLAEAMQVLDAWVFNYRTCIVWVKPSIGPGYWARQQHELLLIATRGAWPTPAPSARPSSVICAPRTKHSEKPAVVYELLERMYPELGERDRIELFARTKRSGWSSWGNEPELAPET
jgi:N6-adenosine-specific RNA methylase IME4